MAERQAITEEMGVRKQWVEEARRQTPETIGEFLRHLMEDYEHDYGTICYAVAAAAVGAAWAVERSPMGGITSFQAGAVMWGMITGWNSTLEGKPLRLLDYDDLLYPQYVDKFTTISKETAEALPGKARKLLEDGRDAHPLVRAHWERLAAGEIPFGLEVRSA